MKFEIPSLEELKKEYPPYDNVPYIDEDDEEECDVFNEVFETYDEDEEE